MNLRWRALVVVAAVSVAAAMFAGGLLWDLASDEVATGIETRIETAVRLLESDVGRADAPATEAALDERVDAAGASVGVRFTVVAPDGTVIADSEFDGAALAALDDHGSREEVIEARRAGEGSVVRYSRSIGSDLLYRARRIDVGPWRGSVVRAAVPATRLDRARSSAAWRLGGAAALAVLLGTLAALYLARRVERPAAELSSVAERAVEGDLSTRARVRADDPLEEVARRWNEALGVLGARLENAAEERDRLNAAVAAMVEGVIATDATGRIVLSNPALIELFGVERGVRGRTPIEALRHAEAAEAMSRAADEAATVSREIEVTHPAPRTLVLQAVGLAGGGAVGVFEDVTALKRAEAVRRDFVANVSHELQTPLATIAGHAEEALDPGVPPAEARDAVAVIARQASRLSEMVRDLLELARVEARGFRPERRPVDLGGLVEELEREWRPRMEAAELELGVDAEAGVVVEAEPTLLRRALENLLDNALKHCPAGSSVTLRLRAGEEAVEIEVGDTGAGIPVEDQPRLFERFYRVEKGRARSTGGTGVGLAIVKHVAEVHGGRVAVESRPGRGATFRLSLPR